MVTEKRRLITFMTCSLSVRMILGDKYFNVDTNDFVSADGVKYKGTPDLYELIFKIIPDDIIYTENDKLA